MGILHSRTSDVADHEGELGREFLLGYVRVLENASAFNVVLGGQEFTESLQQTLEALEYGQVTAQEAQANAQTDATSILERAGQ
jgi:multiple sugar transport system substrate-binding protein